AVAGQVAPPSVPAVELLRVPSVQTLHPQLKPVFLHLDEQVVVRRHHAEGAQAPVHASDAASEAVAEVGAIRVVSEHLDRTGRASRDVVETGLDVSSWSMGHRASL